MCDRLKKCIGSLRRVIACVLSLLMISEVFGGFTAPAEAVGGRGDCIYVLQVSTGNVDGDGIAYFTIEYIDNSNKKQVEVIFPDTAYKAVQNMSSSDISKRLSLAKKLGFSMDSWNIPDKALNKMTTDNYVLTLRKDVKEVTAIGVHADTKTSWTTKGIQFYRVAELGGVKMYGYISTNRYLSFSGNLMAEIQLEDSSLNMNMSSSGEAIYFGNPEQVDLLYGSGVLLSYPSNYNHRKKDVTDRHIIYKYFTSDELYQAATNYSCEESEYLLQVNLADVLGAGIDTYNALFGEKSMSNSGNLLECLSMTMRYLDSAGNYRQVFLPLTVSALTWLDEKNGSSGKTIESLAHFAERGETIQFVGAFPGLVEVDEFYLSYGVEMVNNAAKNITGKSATIDSKAATTVNFGADMKTRAQVLSSSKDSLRISGINLRKLNENSGVQASINTQKHCASYSISGTEVVGYYAAPNYEGALLQVNSYLDITEDQIVDKAASSSALNSKSPDNLYLISMKADSLRQAGTVNDISAVIQYINSNGAEMETESIDIAEAVQKLYGYWPGLSGSEYEAYSKSSDKSTDTNLKFRTSSEMLKDTNYSGKNLTGVSDSWFGGYRYYMRAGQTVQFLAEIEDAASFTGMQLEMKSNNPDDYQLTSVSIDQVVNLGEEYVVFDSDVVTGEGNTAAHTDRHWVRSNMKTNNKVNYVPDNPILLQPNSIVSIDFSKLNQSGDGKSTDENKSIGASSISYQEALRDYAVTRSRMTYTVSVSVATDEKTSIADGDTGSKNQFYFQLVFEKDGKKYTSSYVNANQQMEGDGFRSGDEVSFNIYTNGDYGEIKSVNIIPDDLANSEQTFDKLKIDNITITKASSGTTYSISNVGWIDVAYFDAEAERTNRYESELALNFPVTETTYTTNLEFVLLNSADSSGLKGTYQAVIRYKDTNGKTKSKTVNVSDAIRAYINNSGSGTAESMSDPSYMFLPNRTNRFTVSFTNISSLVDIIFLVQAEEGGSGTWGVQNLAVRQVTGAGALRLKSGGNDDFGEYARDYGTGHASNLCTQRRGEAPKSVAVDGHTPSSLQMFFDTNKVLTVSGDDGEMVAESTPHEAANDEVSLAVVPRSITGLTAADTVTVVLHYQDVYGDSWKSENVALYYDPLYQSFLCKDGGTVSTPLFCIPTYLELESSTKVLVGSVSVKQIRGMEGINNFNRFGVGETSIISGISGEKLVLYVSSDDTKDAVFSDKFMQNVYISFANDSRTIPITTDTDARISFRYYHEDDESGLLYSSGTVSLSSCGITQVGSNTVVKVPFQVAGVKNIHSVCISTTNDEMRLYVDRVAVQQQINRNEDISTAGEVEMGWFNCVLSQSYALSEKNTYFSAAETTAEGGLNSTQRLCPVELTMTTAEDSSDVRSAADGQINLTVYYMDMQNQLCTYSLNNIECALLHDTTIGTGADGQSGFTPATKAVLRLLIPGVSEIMQARFSISDENGAANAAWKLGAVRWSGSYGINGKRSEDSGRQVDDWVIEGTDLYVNLYGQIMKGTLSWEVANGARKSESFNNTSVFLIPVDGTGSVTMAPETANYLPDNLTWLYSYSLLSNGTESMETAVSNGQFDLSGDAIYRLRMYPEELPALSIKVDVAIPAEQITEVTPNEESKTE